jgi:multicomponent Na+:H+ antiporter subunit E
MTPPPAELPVTLTALAWRAGGFGLGWCVLTETRPWANWPLALLVILGATATSWQLRSASGVRLRPLRVLQFIPWFVVQSWLGGFDVARRALSPRMPLQTGFIDAPCRIPPGPARVALIWVLNLQPGTAVVAAGATHLRVHVMDTARHRPESLADLERRVGALFHLP